MKLFSEAKGGACSLRGLGAAWGVQLGKVGGAGADRGSAGEAWGVQMKPRESRYDDDDDD